MTGAASVYILEKVVQGVDRKKLICAAVLASFGDLTPEGRSIIALADKMLNGERVTVVVYLGGRESGSLRLAFVLPRFPTNESGIFSTLLPPTELFT